MHKKPSCCIRDWAHEHTQRQDSPLEAVLDEEAVATAEATAVCMSWALAALVACALSAFHSMS